MRFNSAFYVVVAGSAAFILRIPAGSANGRPVDSESINLGPNPSPAGMCGN